MLQQPLPDGSVKIVVIGESLGGSKNSSISRLGRSAARSRRRPVSPAATLRTDLSTASGPLAREAPNRNPGPGTAAFLSGCLGVLR